MKSKRMTYLLLAVVASIWGVFIFRVFYFTRTAPVDTYPMRDAVIPLSMPAGSRELPAVRTDFPDPFLRELSAEADSTALWEEQETLAMHESSPPVWPRITYAGYIGRPLDKTFIIRIDGVEYIFKMNDLHRDIRLIGEDQEGVWLCFEGEERVFALLKAADSHH